MQNQLVSSGSADFAGLDMTHRLMAQVSREQTAGVAIAQVEARGDANAARLELGPLEPDAAYPLRVAVVQNDGAEMVTNTYRFRSLAGVGWVRDTLQLVQP